MSTGHAKKLLPELVIAGAALFGLWSIMIAPMRAGLATAHSAHVNAIEHARIAGDPELSTPKLRRVMGTIDTMIGDIEQRSDIARDQTALQASLMEIGARSGVRIERVSPAKARSISLKKGSVSDEVASFEIECSGLYRDIAGFVARIEADLGLTLIDRISIRPDTAASGSAVRARLRTLHFAFDTTPAPSADAIANAGSGHQ
jgi:hypothetical protein